MPVCALRFALLAGAPPARAAPVPLIIDTDVYSDVDDAGALAVANALEDQGAARILAVMVDTPSRWGAPAVDAINTYYHHQQIPIGTLKPVDDSEPSTPYPRYLAQHFTDALKDGARAPDAISLYRQVLAAQPDHSVVIDSIGLLTNLSHLLDSPPDAISPLTGAELVTRKVKVLDVMGGLYPAGQEFNFLYDPASADPLTTFFAVRGPAGLLTPTGEGGINVVSGPTATDAWTPLPGNRRGEHYLVKTTSDATIAGVLNAEMIQAPGIEPVSVAFKRHHRPRRHRRHRHRRPRHRR